MTGELPLPGIGHNAAPEEAVVFDRAAEVMQGAEIWATRVPRIEDEETANAANDFLDQIAKAARAMESERKRQKEYWDKGAKDVQERFKPVQNRLEAAKARVNALLEPYLRAKRERLAAEARAREEQARREAEEARRIADEASKKTNPIEAAVAAQEAEEAQRRAATAAKATVRAETGPVRVTGENATRARSMRAYWSAEVTDYRKTALWYLSKNPVPEAIMNAIKQTADAEAREKKEAFAVPGCSAKKEERLA